MKEQARQDVLRYTWQIRLLLSDCCYGLTEQGPPTLLRLRLTTPAVTQHPLEGPTSSNQGVSKVHSHATVF